jgi:hypothetical protein
VVNGFTTPAGFQPAVEGDYSKMPGWTRVDVEVGGTFN